MFWILLGIAALGLIAYFRERSQRRTHAMPGGPDFTLTLPHKEAFELYHNDFSLCSKKVRMCLDELGIRYRAHHIDLVETGRYENIGRAYLKVNPAGIVPVLVHNGHPIYESHEIIHYAAKHALQANTLTPASPEDFKQMDEWIQKSSIVGDGPDVDLKLSAANCIPAFTLPLFATMIQYIPVSRILEGLLFHRLKYRPMIFLLLKLLGIKHIHRLPPVRKLVRASQIEMARHLDDLEAQLEASGGPWILGGQFTLADVSWAVLFERLREAVWLDELQINGRPRVSTYWMNIKSRPSYASSMLNFEHPLVLRGQQDILAFKQRKDGVYELGAR